VPLTKKSLADEAVAAYDELTAELALGAKDAVKVYDPDNAYEDERAYELDIEYELDCAYDADNAYDADKAYDAENPTSIIDSAPLSFFRYNLPSNVFKANSPNST
jgi:post-segregation antitoxin (ccd killing protein)